MKAIIATTLIVLIITISSQKGHCDDYDSNRPRIHSTHSPVFNSKPGHREHQTTTPVNDRTGDMIPATYSAPNTAGNNVFGKMIGLVSKFDHKHDNVAPGRTDTDLTMNYILNENVRILIGCKKIDLDDKHGTSVHAGPSISTAVNFPMQPAGMAHPLLFKINVSLYQLFALDAADRIGSSQGYSAELGMSYSFSQWAVNLGYKYRALTISGNEDGGSIGAENNRSEATYGPAIEINYLFP